MYNELTFKFKTEMSKGFSRHHSYLVTLQFHILLSCCDLLSFVTGQLMNPFFKILIQFEFLVKNKEQKSVHFICSGNEICVICENWPKLCGFAEKRSGNSASPNKKKK